MPDTVVLQECNVRFMVTAEASWSQLWKTWWL